MRYILINALVYLLAGIAAARDPALRIVAEKHSRQTVYHSPQKPGFTCWVGAWKMPDGDFMISFTQATGPTADRPRAPAEILKRLDWPFGGDAGYDMTGLDLRNVHLRSTDGGATWKKVSADAFRSPMNGVTGECETALSTGTVVRGVFGFYLPYNPELPQTGFLQRSTDGAKTWGKAETLVDAKKYALCWPRRLRLLRDGRLLLLGGLVRISRAEQDNAKTRNQLGRLLEPMLLVSKDDGKTWSEPLEVVAAADRLQPWYEEWDAAELANGDLLCVFRRPDAKANRLGLLKKEGQGWSAATLKPAPFPQSGHPELLATSQGVILHFSPSGIHATADAGTSWQRLDVRGSAYYPRSVEGGEGWIHVFGHHGSDDPYGKVDQSIVMDKFRLVQN